MAPRISVVLATHNNVETIESAVDSVLNQSFRDFELLIICDGSQDGTCELIKKYSSLENVSIIELETNIGKPLAFNIAVAHSKGIWIGVMDGDDIWLENKLETQMAFLLDNPEVQVLGTNLLRFGVWGQETFPSKLYLSNDSIHQQFTFAKMGFNNPTVLFQKKAFYAVGGYRGHMVRVEDFDLFLRMHRTGMQFANLKDVLVHYRTSSITQPFSYWFRNEIKKWQSLRENRYPWPFRFYLTSRLAYFVMFFRMVLYFGVLKCIRRDK